MGLPPTASLPPGGQLLSLKADSGSGTARAWTDLFAPVVQARFGIALWPGSLNLWADAPITWEEPLLLHVESIDGEFCPVVLNEAALGLAFRRRPYTPHYLEVIAPIELRPRLGGIKDGDTVAVRLLSGSLLKPAA